MNKAQDNNTNSAFFGDNVIIGFNPNSFILDFTNCIPKFTNLDKKVKQTNVIEHNTVILSSKKAKQLLQQLQNNIESFESQFGEIELENVKKEGDITYIG